MYQIKVGQVVDEFKGHPEGAKFDIDDSGAMMVVFFRSPTAHEIEQFASDKSFVIKFIDLYGVIMFTAKIGDLNWIDAPYTPHLSSNLTELPTPAEGQGLGLTLTLIDAATGEIKHMRLLGLSEGFSKKIINVVKEHRAKPFDGKEYTCSLNKIFAAYRTKHLADLSKDYCKIN